VPGREAFWAAALLLAFALLRTAVEEHPALREALAWALP
jgi:hypothetical protein